MNEDPVSVRVPCPYCFAMVLIRNAHGAPAWVHERSACDEFIACTRPDTLRRMRRQFEIAVKAIAKGPS